MPYKITLLEVPNHQIKVKQTETRASIELDTPAGFQGFNNDFVLLIGLEELHRPRMWYVLFFSILLFYLYYSF